MEIIDFKDKLSKANGVSLNDEFVLFNDYELYSTITNESIMIKSFDELLKQKIGDETIEEMIKKREKFEASDNGGRGASSGGTTIGGKLFSGGRRGDSFPSGGNMPAAYVNTLTSARFKSVDATAKAFGKKTLNEYREYSAALDENGFATKYNKGGKSSTAHLVQKDGYSIHNHPTKDKSGKTIAWNIYSKADLQNSALDSGRGTIVVSNGNRTMYKFTKNKNFNSKAFIKGLNQAKATTGNYDKDVDSWLKKNQKEYGYTYKKSKF